MSEFFHSSAPDCPPSEYTYDPSWADAGVVEFSCRDEEAYAAEQLLAEVGLHREERQ